MKNIKVFLAILFIGFLALSLTTCGWGGRGGKGGAGPTTELVSISVTPANPYIPVGLSEQLAVSGIYSDGTSHDISTQVTWRSSNTLVAAVNSSGLATAVAKGTTAIIATSGRISGSTAFTVTSAILSSIAVTPANPSIRVGSIQQLTATGTFSDGTSRDLTFQVSWTSNSSIATVGSSGLARAVAAGTAIIAATSGSISGNTTLTGTSD